MVGFKKQISIILILSLFLSLTPNFLYNGGREILAGCTTDESCTICPPGTKCPCPSGCDGRCSKGQCLCFDCPLPGRCNWGKDFEFKHESCLPEEGAGEWGCGKEIPIGEVILRTSLLADKMEQQFVKGIIENANIMIDEIKGTPAKQGLLDKLDSLSCKDSCKVECHKYFNASEWLLKGGTAGCNATIGENRSSDARENCQKCDNVGLPCSTECNSCPIDENSKCAQDDCLIAETITTIGETVVAKTDCKYYPNPVYCTTNCDIRRWAGVNYCTWKDNPFSSVNGYSKKIESSKERLIKDINGAEQPEKFKIEYIEKQLNYARCELSKCYISAEEYPKVMTGELAGKHLFSCKSVTEMGLLEDDQIECLSLQAMAEFEKLVEAVTGYWEQPRHWWEYIPIVMIVEVSILIVKNVNWGLVWDVITELFKSTAEEGCFPGNYYCCQM